MDTLGRVFFVLWGTLVGTLHAHALWRGWRACRWPATTGEVLAAGVRYHSGRLGGYLPEVRYRYAVGGQTFTGERLRFGGRTLQRERVARRALGEVAVGAWVPVHYDPRRPGDAVLQPGVLVGDVAWLLVGLIALGIGSSVPPFGPSAR